MEQDYYQSKKNAKISELGKIFDLNQEQLSATREYYNGVCYFDFYEMLRSEDFDFCNRCECGAAKIQSDRYCNKCSLKKRKEKKKNRSPERDYYDFLDECDYQDRIRYGEIEDCDYCKCGVAKLKSEKECEKCYSDMRKKSKENFMKKNPKKYYRNVFKRTLKLLERIRAQVRFEDEHGYRVFSSYDLVEVFFIENKIKEFRSNFRTDRVEIINRMAMDLEVKIIPF